MTVRFLADEDIDADIIKGLRSREPAIDILDVKTAGLRGTGDPALLELAAERDRRYRRMAPPRLGGVAGGRVAKSAHVSAVPVKGSTLGESILQAVPSSPAPSSRNIVY